MSVPPLGPGPTGPGAGPRPARRRPGALRVALVAALLLPVLELFVLIQVGRLIGAVWTVGLVLLGVLVGLRIVTRQGRAAFVDLGERLGRHAPPDARAAGDAALVMLGGLLLAFPGFVTDVLGLALLLPPTRSVVRRLVGRVTRGRVLVVRDPRTAGPAAGPAQRGTDPRGTVRGEVVDGEVLDD